MLNFIYAELWRHFHRPAGKALLILAAGLPVLLSLYIFIGLHWVQMGDIFTQTVGVVAVLMPFAGIFFLVGIVDVSFADELRRATLKNHLAAGVSRPVIYGGKILSGLLLAILHLVLALAAFSLSAAPLLSLDILEIFDSMGLLLLEVLPLWLGGGNLRKLIPFPHLVGCQRSGGGDNLPAEFGGMAGQDDDPAHEQGFGPGMLGGGVLLFCCVRGRRVAFLPPPGNSIGGECFCSIIFTGNCGGRCEKPARRSSFS